MPRNPRLDYTDSIVHVISRGVDRRDIFSNDGDRLFFLRLMREAFRHTDIRVIAWCLMGNHFHLLLSTGSVDLGKPMHVLLQRYAMYFNRRHGRVGHLFQGRYKAFRILSTRRLYRAVDYIHNNPVAARFVTDTKDWPWSSHHEFVSGEFKRIDHSRLEEVGGVAPADLREGYLDAYEERREPSQGQRPIEVHLEIAADVAGVDVEDVVGDGKGEQLAKARKIFMFAAATDGYSQAVIAAALGRTQGAVSQALRNIS